MLRRSSTASSFLDACRRTCRRVAQHEGCDAHKYAVTLFGVGRTDFVMLGTDVSVIRACSKFYCFAQLLSESFCLFCGKALSPAPTRVSPLPCLPHRVQTRFFNDAISSASLGCCCDPILCVCVCVCVCVRACACACVCVHDAVQASMTPQWRGLVNGTIIYIVLGFIAGFCRMFVSKTNQP